jgi:pyridoxal phosphate enzyme (YggS family)
MDPARLRANLEAVRARIAAACRRAGRNPAGVTLVVVTKTAPAELIPGLAALGVTDVGEHRPLEGLRRVGPLRQFRRHMIGHIQTNKLRKTLEWADVIHSLDRPALLEAMARTEPRRPVYVQVNVSGEPTKGGYRPEEVGAAVAAARAAGLEVLGLMTMAPRGGDARGCFRRLRELAAREGLAGLSMGMSEDLEMAVEEGATCVRVGSAVFEGLRV